MKPVVHIALTAILLAACGTSAPPTQAPGSPATAAPTEAGTAAPSEAPTQPATAAPTPAASGTLTPAAPDPGVAMIATWWLDPASLPIDPSATQLRGFVLERECASGQSPEGRILAPDVDYGADALTISISIAPLPGAQDCQGNTPFGIIFELEEPVGERPIFDGGTVPARDATTIPGS